ncbi:MAG: OsmC family protein [Alphaproteobacteria bacterium]|nr:OsmC family protein [Alphaproteobacteria bacterium]
MTEYKSVILWDRNGASFIDNQYSRAHKWLFDGGIEIPASASPHIVPFPLSIEAAIDPEEAFVASISSCHMLFFLSIAAKHKFIVETYRDEAIGLMAKDISGKIAITQVTLYPQVNFTGNNKPGSDEIISMHHTAHNQCFIANSVKTDIKCNPIGIT